MITRNSLLGSLISLHADELVNGAGDTHAQAVALDQVAKQEGSLWPDFANMWTYLPRWQWAVIQSANQIKTQIKHVR